MKKKNTILVFAVLALLLFSTASLNLQAQSFEKGDKDINLTIGFLSSWYENHYFHASIPQIAISGDYGLRDDWGPGVFGVGAFISLTTYKYRWSIYEDGKYTYINIAARATYHYQFVKKLDTYGGVLLGVQIRRFKEPEGYPAYYNSRAGVGAMGTLFVGAKYYVTDKFSILSEICIYDAALFNIGAGFKF
jgi:hypothetical protein